ncbi:MAG: porin family protein [Candidatus Neomarinimicrobiota bacterium]
MKKLLILLISLSFVSLTSLTAQEFGIKGGVNLGKWTGDDIKEIADELDEKFDIGYSAGAFVSFPLGEMFSVRPEVLYTNNGAQFEGSEDGFAAKMAIKMNWINIPVLAVYNLTPNIKVFGGPYFDIFLSGAIDVEMSYLGVSIDEKEDIEKDEITSLAYGAVAGAAVGVGKGMELELRYSKGINTLDRKPDDWDDSFGDYDEADFKPSMIQILLNFNLSKN